MLEKIYGKVISASVVSVVCGIVSIVAGVSTGVTLIVFGAKLLAARKDMDL